MKINVKLWIWGVFFLVNAGQNGFAQSPSGEDDVFDSIRTQMISMAKKNNALARKNKELKARLVSLQLEIERHEKKLKEVDSDSVIRERTGWDSNKTRPGEPASLTDLKNDPLIQEARDLYLSGQSMDLAPEQKLRELQLYDLQIQKQESLLDLKDKQALYKEVESKRRQELDGYEKEIQENRKKENDLSLRIAEMKRKAKRYPREIDLLKMENKQLKRKIAVLKQMSSR